MTCEAVHCFDKASVRFALYPDGIDGPRLLGEISEDALRDVFGARGNGDSLVAACKANFDVIEACALARFRRQPQGNLDLVTDDFSYRNTLTMAVQPPAVGPANASSFRQAVAAG